jgi:hypothetical protein
MPRRPFDDWQTAGGGDDFMRLLQALKHEEIPWRMIGGLALSYWSADPVATANVDVSIAAERGGQAAYALEKTGFKSKRFEGSTNLCRASSLSVLIRTKVGDTEFPDRAFPAVVHGTLMRVASLNDPLVGKLLAWQDKSQRPVKMQKDLTDITRWVETHPELLLSLPAEVATWTAQTRLVEFRDSPGNVWRGRQC